MKLEKSAMLEMSDEEKGLGLTDELLEGVNGAGLHRKPRRKPRTDWTDVDPEDGSSGITYTW